MSVLSIIKPNPVIAGAFATGVFSNGSRVLTPDPKEAAITTGVGNGGITLDLGGNQSVDTMFLGYCNGVYPTFDAAYSVDGTTYTNISTGVQAAVKNMDNTNRHYFLRFAPVSARYFRWASASLVAGFSVGISAVGQTNFAINPTYGHEWGSGRAIIDTGSATRLKSGGFGIDEGVTVGGWQFTLGDLTDDETDFLYELLKSVGVRGTMLVVEDPDLPGIGHNKLHWSIFQRIDYFERVMKNRSRWSLKVEEWA